MHSMTRPTSLQFLSLGVTSCVPSLPHSQSSACDASAGSCRPQEDKHFNIHCVFKSIASGWWSRAGLHGKHFQLSQGASLSHQLARDRRSGFSISQTRFGEKSWTGKTTNPKKEQSTKQWKNRRKRIILRLFALYSEASVELRNTIEEAFALGGIRVSEATTSNKASIRASGPALAPNSLRMQITSCSVGAGHLRGCWPRDADSKWPPMTSTAA